MSTFIKGNPTLGFIGQGWIGKNYADHYEERGFKVIRYGLQEEFQQNQSRIQYCDIVFIAVPTPSTPNGFDDSILREVLKLVGKGSIAIIKSTIMPGTTEKMQAQFPDIIVLHSPEFLTEKTARYDVDHPQRNIIGYVDSRGNEAAHEVINIFPSASYQAIIPAKTAELIKYTGNCWFYFKVVYLNMVYDLSNELGVDYEKVKEAISFDTRIGHTHLEVMHQGGRGAGGHCFIKDFAAFAQMYHQHVPHDESGHALLGWAQLKNNELLKTTGKDLELLRGVYGEQI